MPADALRAFLAAHQDVLPPRSRLLIACSGGPDSMALVRAAADAALPYTFVIGHVDHGLRGRFSTADARFVKAAGLEFGWPTLIEKVRRDGAERGGVEEWARAARYAALRRLARRSRCAAILTAHTLDDQAETVLMNLLRGSGPRGLGGMAPLRRPDGWAVWLGRPLLSVRRADVLSFLRSHRQEYRKDSSNDDVAFHRNWIRRRVVPLLESRAPAFQSRLATMAEIVRDEEAFWEATLRRVEGRLLRRRAGGWLLDMRGLLRYSAAVQRRLLRRIAGQDLLTFTGLENLRRWMQSPPTNGRHWQLRKGWIVQRLSRSGGSPSSTIFWLGRPKTSKG